MKTPLLATLLRASCKALLFPKKSGTIFQDTKLYVGLFFQNPIFQLVQYVYSIYPIFQLIPHFFIAPTIGLLVLSMNIPILPPPEQLIHRG